MSPRLLLLGLISVLSVVVAFWSYTPGQAISMLRHGGFWSVGLTFALFVWMLLRSLWVRPLTADALRQWQIPLALVLVVSLWVQVHETHGFKIVADELLLQHTARQMHFHREAAVVVRGYDYAGSFTAFDLYVDKRPLFFPFLLALMHGLIGFRPENAFVLNGLVTFGLFLLLFLLGRRIGGKGAGYTAVLLTAGIPLIAQNATGSGFELLNLTMLLMTLWLGMRAADQPLNCDRLAAFVLAGALLAQVRYESALFIAPVGLAVLYLWWLARRPLIPWPLFLVPPLLILCAFQLKVFESSETAWQLAGVEGADRPFALRYLYDNLGHALNFLISWDGKQPSSLLVSVAGPLGVGLTLLSFFRGERKMLKTNPALTVFAIFVFGLCAHALVMMCYFWGKWDDPIIRRLSLPTLILFVLGITRALAASGPRIAWRYPVTIAAGFALAVTVPLNAVHRHTQEIFAARVTNWLVDHIKTYRDRSVFAIDQKGLVWMLYGKSSVSPEMLAPRIDGFLMHYRNRSFSEFLVVQRATPNVQTGERLLAEEDVFGEALELELIEERAFAPLYVMRLSRIVGVNEERLRVWAAARPRSDEPVGANWSGFTPAEQSHLMEWLRQLP